MKPQDQSKKRVTLPVEFFDYQYEWLKEVSEKMDLSKGHIVRGCVEDKMKQLGEDAKDK